MRIFDTLHAQANDARLPGERFTATAGNRSVDRAGLIAPEFHGAPRKGSWRTFADKISRRGYCGRYQAPPALLQQTRGEVTYLAGKLGIAHVARESENLRTSRNDTRKSRKCGALVLLALECVACEAG